MQDMDRGLIERQPDGLEASKHGIAECGNRAERVIEPVADCSEDE
jgi:hypothetical protein